MLKNKKIYITNLLNFIFILYALTFLVNSGLERLCVYFSTLLWLLEGNFKEKFKQLLNQKVILFYLGMILLFYISLSFFSDSIQNGFWDAKYSNGYKYIFSKNITFFVIAIYISTSLKKEYLKYILIAFVFQAVYMALYSYGIYFGFLDGTKDDPVHFIHHIFFSITMSIAFFSSLTLLLKTKNIYIKIVYCIFCALLLIDLFIIGGRLGQLAFLVALLAVLYYYIIIHKRKSHKKIILPFLLISIALLTVFNLSSNFQNRIDQGVSDIKKVLSKGDFSTSWGVRIGYDIVNINLLLQNPKNFIFGLGMGDSKKKIETYIMKTDIKKLPILEFNHVHNQFFQIWIDGGIAALFLYLSIFFSILTLKIKFHEKLLAIAFVSIFLSMGIGDIMYHRATILGLFALFLGYFLATEKYHNETQRDQ